MAATYPLRVDARLDLPLSRWRWAVKWVLVLPHYVVLAFLWLAFTISSGFALVAIVATGRYPPARIAADAPPWPTAEELDTTGMSDDAVFFAAQRLS